MYNCDGGMLLVSLHSIFWQPQGTYLLDGGMEQAHLILAGLAVAGALLSNQAPHSRQEAVHSVNVLGAPDLQAKRWAARL